MDIPTSRTKLSVPRADARGNEEPAHVPSDGIVPGTTAPARIVLTRLFGVGAGAFGVPVGAWLIWPAFGMALASAETIVVLAVVFTALYGSSRYSSRAFRLLRWSLDRSEPPAHRAPGPRD